MRTSENGIQFIKSNEGLRLTIYDDNGKPAIGYGHDLLPGESYPDGITQEQAEELLRQDLPHVEAIINGLAPTTITQNQFDALADFAYNLGIGSLQTMLGHGWDQVPDQIPRWCDVNGKPSAGLLARRNKEVAMFNC